MIIYSWIIAGLIVAGVLLENSVRVGTFLQALVLVPIFGRVFGWW